MTRKYINSPHSGIVGCQPAPIIFPLANEFAKGKMFWNLVINLYLYYMMNLYK